MISFLNRPQSDHSLSLVQRITLKQGVIREVNGVSRRLDARGQEIEKKSKLSETQPLCRRQLRIGAKQSGVVKRRFLLKRVRCARERDGTHAGTPYRSGPTVSTGFAPTTRHGAD
ncbi:unnamed protein product [Colias eurytheme]|nr:unnamed protein product [Colias eurytheme]